MKNQLINHRISEVVNNIIENHHNYIGKTIPHLLRRYIRAINHADQYPFMKRVLRLDTVWLCN